MNEIDILEDIREIDDIMEVQNINRHPKIYRQHQDPFQIYNDQQFKRRYRMNKNTARDIIALIRRDISPLRGNSGRPVSPELQFLATIRYLSKGAYEEDMADHAQFHQSTLSRIIRRVVIALSQHRDQFIRLPEGNNEIQETKRKFFNLYQFPSVIGAIDCTHIKIKRPTGENAEEYINRKGFYSLNVQVISDADCKIRHIVARWRGSVHDSRIWNECNLKPQFENRRIKGILLGDNGYATTNYLLTPLLNPVSQAEQRYNRSHIRTRNVVERLFGQWKNKFRCLFNGLGLNLDTSKAAIVASAIIHNICIDRRDNNDAFSDEEDIQDDNNDINNENNNDLRGNAFRRHFINTYFN